MLAKAHEIGSSENEGQGHPVIRTLYDHLEGVTCLEFHPNKPILASGSRDCHVKFFDYSKITVKKAYKTITVQCLVKLYVSQIILTSYNLTLQDVVPIRCISFHPLGDYMVVGTNCPIIRLYDINTVQSYVSSVPSQQHTGPVTSIKY